MRVRIIRNLHDLFELKARWNALLDGSCGNVPFYSWDWYSTWWKHFGQNSRPFVLVAEDGIGKAVGIAPLMLTRRRIRGLPVTDIGFLDNSIAPRNAILLQSGDIGMCALRAIVQCLADQRSEWDIVTLANIETQAHYLAELLERMHGLELCIIRDITRRSPYLHIEGDFAGYCAKQLSAKDRKNVRRSIKMLNVLGCYRVTKYSDPRDIAAALQLAFQVSANSWKARLGTHMNGSCASEAFYGDITRVLAEQQQVWIWVASLDDRPIAIRYQLVSKHAVHSLVTDFDETVRHCSPGSALLYHVLEQIHAEKLEEYDFAGDAYEHKMKWASGVREHVTIQAFNRNWYSRFIFKTKTHFLPWFRRIRDACGRHSPRHPDEASGHISPLENDTHACRYSATT